MNRVRKMSSSCAGLTHTLQRRGCPVQGRACRSEDSSPTLVALLSLVAGVLFILALRGLSSPDSSRRGNLLGMIGMAIAVLTTLGSHPPASPLAWGLVVGGIAIGGSVGAVIARRGPMTSMPGLVAAFHSLVGLGAGPGGAR